MILIVAGPRDVHARAVADLIARTGKSVRIVDLSRFGIDANLSWLLGSAGVASGFDGRDQILFDDIETIWYRRPRLSMVAEHVPDRKVRSFCREEWINLIEGVFLNSSARFVNPLTAEFAAVKPRQLQVARESGLTLPDTLITNDADAATRFIARHGGRVIHKALTAPKSKLIDTKLWNEQDEAHLSTLTLAPVIFQEAVSGACDIRATYVGGEIFAARIDTRESRAGIDSRLDLDARYTAVSLPEEVTDKLRRFMGAMNLVYGTIDMKIADDGNYVFFEVNPQGQFLYVELLTGLPIAQAVASYLSSAPERPSP